MKLADLKTAREIHREDPWQVKLLYTVGWVPNQIQILWLKWKTRES